MQTFRNAWLKKVAFGELQPKDTDAGPGSALNIPGMLGLHELAEPYKPKAHAFRREPAPNVMSFVGFLPCCCALRGAFGSLCDALQAGKSASDPNDDLDDCVSMDAKTAQGPLKDWRIFGGLSVVPL